jgi:hypothetical protein
VFLAGARPRLLSVVVEQLRLDEVELDQLVGRGRQASPSGPLGSQPGTEDEPLASAARSGEEIRRALAAAESRVIRRAIEAAKRAQQQRLFASLGRR